MGNCHTMNQETDQLVLRRVGGQRTVRNGLGFVCTGPMTSVEKREALVLQEREYGLVVNQLEGSRKMVDGPTVYFLEAYEEVSSQGSYPVLRNAQYVKIRDRQTGLVRIVHGPGVVTFSAWEKLGEVSQSPQVAQGRYVRVRDTVTGMVRTEVGPKVVELTAMEEVLGEVRELPVLGKGEYARVRDTQTGKLRVAHGPGVVDLGSFEEVVGEPRPLPNLGLGEYCIVRDVETGRRRVANGPCIVELGAMDEVVGGTRHHPVLSSTEYCRVRDDETGVERIETGPKVVQLGAHESVVEAATPLPVLSRGEYARVRDERDGGLRAVFGPCVVDLGTYERVAETGRCPDLSGDEYLVVKSEEDGSLRNVVGPQLFHPGVFDSYGEVKKVINLRRVDYVKILGEDGSVRVERGEQRLVPRPLDSVLGEVQQAIMVDPHHAVLVRNTDAGSLELVTEHGLFFPRAFQEVVEVQEKIVLEKYQTVVCKDAMGRFYYASGNTDLPEGERGPGPAFFLPPHHAVVRMSWSTDLRKEHAECEEVWKFDQRPSYMNYEFECRTLDNVELIVDVTFFWRIIDVRAMIEGTADAPGDACTHARSMILQQISKVKLMDFLETFNELIRDSCLGDPFYQDRGIELLSVEVLKFECASQETNGILQEIIRETCDRLKNKERQRGENEVALERLDGEIAEERKKQELVEVRKSHLRTEARIEGEAEGTRISAFLTKLASCSVDGADLGGHGALEIFEMLRQYDFQLDSTRALASGNAQLYLLPDQVNLNLGTLHNPTASSLSSSSARPQQKKAPKAVFHHAQGFAQTDPPLLKGGAKRPGDNPLSPLYPDSPLSTPEDR